MGQPPGEPTSLATRNLLRSLTMKVPSGQRVAKAMQLPVLAPADLADLGDLHLATRTPLWFYILREADVVRRRRAPRSGRRADRRRGARRARRGRPPVLPQPGSRLDADLRQRRRRSPRRTCCGRRASWRRCPDAGRGGWHSPSRAWGPARGRGAARVVRGLRRAPDSQPPARDADAPACGRSRRDRNARGGAEAGAVAPRWIRADLRSPDARSPLMRAEGAWRCPAGSSALLQVGRYGTATLSSGGRPLAYVTGRRALIHRVCEPAAAAPGRTGTPPFGRNGPGLLRCRASGALTVDFAAGDLTVRAGRRFLAGAAVGAEHFGVARYWAAACRPA